MLVEKVERLATHSYIAYQQTAYFKNRKENLKSNVILSVGDFVENYGFILQDKIQSYHWSNNGCNIHIVVLYFQQNEELCHISLCFVSNDLLHDVELVWKNEQELTDFIKGRYPFIQKME
jgi:hypothetical protein